MPAPIPESPLDRYSAAAEILVCPATKQPLRRCSIEEATGDGPLFTPLRPSGGTRRMPFVMLRADGAAAYPIVEGTPLLLAPEALVRSGSKARPYDVADPPYAEAYHEMVFYNDAAGGSGGEAEREEYAGVLRRVAHLTSIELKRFPEPKELWLDAVYDSAAQMDCYRHLAPLTDATIMQLGGKGIHAVKFLLAGAAEAWLVTPMADEVRWAIAFAEMLGVAERLRCAIAICEELPFRDAVFDGIYGGGTVHHLFTSLAMPEIRRVLRAGGRFAAQEPWRSPGYGIGTRIFGKREANAFCRPLDRSRVAPMFEAFPKALVTHHGALTRYLLLALSKLHFVLGLNTVWKIGAADDAVSSYVPGLRRLGSSVALLAAK
jgi:uncharacterized protein YbaR (Trm112 family)/SAM-dependent methyltransferase